jgi:tellurite resistance protein TehA-like permease
MNPQESPTKNAKMYAVIGVGLAGFYAAYQFATEAPKEGTPSTTVPIIFVVIGVVCLLVAAYMARKRRTE